ncbi:MAG: M20/M25/M40 family metallo-hydrolase [Thalassotalea sp.]
MDMRYQFYSHLEKSKVKPLKQQVAKKQFFPLLAGFIFAVVSPLLSAKTEIISLTSMTADIEFLASDNLKGRAAGSPESKLAANYIAERFNNIGLSALNSATKNNTASDYLQTFNSYEITQQALSVIINDKSFAKDALAMVSNQPTINWQDTSKIQVSVVNGHKDLYPSLLALNEQGGQHLVLVNKKHRAIFKQLQKHFSRPQMKVDIEQPATMLLVLSNSSTIKTLDVQASFNHQKQTLNNVIGVLPGKSKADEIIIYSAHYDHLGTIANDPANGSYNSTNAQDIIYNGADDDASGTTAVIQLAEYFKQQNNNERTLLFVTFTAEELGGFGSQYFSWQLNPDDIKAMVNIEMIGKPSTFGAGTLWMTGFKRSNLAGIMNNTLAQQTDTAFKRAEIYQDPYPAQKLFYRSDNATLARLGVPAHSFSSTQLDKDQHYHQVSDEVSTLTLPSMQKVIETLAIASKTLVSGEQTPTRVDTSQVKPHGKIF